MSEPRCPHCQTVLPEKAAFCAACGNRIEGWSAIPEGERPTLLPGGEEPTTNVQPTPSLLRAAALSKKPGKKSGGEKAENSDSDGEAKPSGARPIGVLALIVVGAGAAVAAYYLASRPPPTSPVSLSAPAPSPSLLPSLLPSLARTVATLAAPDPPAAAPPRNAKSARHAHRIEPLQIAAKTRSQKSGGGLPHKSVPTDSRPLSSTTATSPPTKATHADPAASAAALATHDDAPVEATPQTDEEMKKAAQASLDADGIRFVVKSHLAQVHACYERAFKESSPGGRVEIGFAITPDGSAARVRTETNTTGSEPLAACLESRIRSWQFPRPVGGDYELIYPFVFAAGS